MKLRPIYILMILLFAVSALAQPGNGGPHPQRYDRIWKNVFNVKAPEYGAVGDSTIADSAVFATVTEAMSSGDVMLVPPGQHLIGDTLYIPKNCGLVGYGPESKLYLRAETGIIHMDSGAWIDNIMLLPDDTSGIDADTNSIGVYLLMQRGTTGGAQDNVRISRVYGWIGAKIVNAHGVTVTDCQWEGGGHDRFGGALTLEDNTEAVVSNSHFYWSGKNEIQLLGNNQDITIADCYLEGDTSSTSNGHSGVLLQNSGDGPPAGGYRLTIRGGAIWGHPTHNGIDINPDHYEDSLGVKIIGVDIFSNNSTGIYVNGSGVDIDNCTIYNNGEEAIRFLWNTAADSSQISRFNSITNCKFIDNDTLNNGSDYQVQVFQWAQSTMDGNEYYWNKGYVTGMDAAIAIWDSYDVLVQNERIWAYDTTSGFSDGDSMIIYQKRSGFTAPQDSIRLINITGLLYGDDTTRDNTLRSFPNNAAGSGSVDSVYFKLTDSTGSSRWVTPGDTIWHDTSGGGGGLTGFTGANDTDSSTLTPDNEWTVIKSPTQVQDTLDLLGPMTMNDFDITGVNALYADSLKGTTSLHIRPGRGTVQTNGGGSGYWNIIAQNGDTIGIRAWGSGASVNIQADPPTTGTGETVTIEEFIFDEGTANFPDNSIVDSMIDTTGVVVSNAGHATLADSAIAIPDSVVGTSFTSTGADSGQVILYTSSGGGGGSVTITIPDTLTTDESFPFPGSWYGGGSGTNDSVAWDTSGGGVFAYTYPTNIREGAGIDLTVDIDTAYIAATLGASIALAEMDANSVDSTKIVANAIGESELDIGTGAQQIGPSDFANEDIGDISIVGGAWAVEDNSHAHDSTTLSANSVGASELANGAVDSASILQSSRFYMPLWRGSKIFGTLTTQEGGIDAQDTLSLFDGPGLKISSNQLQVDTTEVPLSTIFGTRLKTTLADGYIWVGNGSNVATATDTTGLFGGGGGVGLFDSSLYGTDSAVFSLITSGDTTLQYKHDLVNDSSIMRDPSGTLVLDGGESGGQVNFPDGIDVIDQLDFGTAVGDTLDLDSLNSEHIVVGVQLVLPTSVNPSTTVEGELKWDSDDDMLESSDGSSSFIMAERYHTFMLTIDDPDNLVCDTVLLPIRGFAPGGITIDSIGVGVNDSIGTYAVVFQEWTDRDVGAGTESSIATVTVPTNAFDNVADGVDHTIEYANIIAIILPSTDQGRADIWIRYEILGND